MILHSFSLVPGGFTRETQPQDLKVNEAFSDTILESMQRLLASSVTRKQEAEQVREAEGSPDESSDKDYASEAVCIQKLVDFMDRTRKTEDIRVGGFFPLLIAQKSTRMFEEGRI